MHEKQESVKIEVFQPEVFVQYNGVKVSQTIVNAKNI